MQNQKAPKLKPNTYIDSFFSFRCEFAKLHLSASVKIAFGLTLAGNRLAFVGFASFLCHYFFCLFALFSLSSENTSKFLQTTRILFEHR